MNDLIKQLEGKTNEELAVLIFKLKLTLMENRFKKQAGEFDKNHLLKEIRTTIAHAMTVLSKRKYDISIGVHGLTLYNKQDNTAKSLNNLVSDALAQMSKIGGVNSNNVVDNGKKETFTGDSTMNVKNEVKGGQVKQVNVEKTIRKTQGGGQ